MTPAELDAALARHAAEAWVSLGDARLGTPPSLAFPPSFRDTLSVAIAVERADRRDDAVADLVRHYTDVMPRMRVAQVASTAEPGATLFHTRLDWSRLPRLCAALDRLFAVVGSDADAFRGRTPTLAALHGQTYYGSFMPLLYGYPADLAYFARQSSDTHATIDRYLTAPLVHELCHFAPDREVRLPLHLDECVGGWLGVYVHPELAYPAAGHDDAIYAAPWLAQVGQAIARAFGVAATVRTHAGLDAELPPEFLAAAARLGRDDWHARRTLHFLSDTFDPTPWIALALVGGAGHSLAAVTLESLAATPLATLALPDDPAFDRAIVEDALRAMCLANMQIDGSFRARTALPGGPIAIDAIACRVTTARRGTIDPVAPSYWLPPAIAARLAAHAITGYELRLDSIAAIPVAANAICAASSDVAGHGFTLHRSPPGS